MAIGAPVRPTPSGNARTLGPLDWTWAGCGPNLLLTSWSRRRQLLVHVAVAALAASYSMLAAAPGHAQTAWPNTFKARLEALALLQSLNADLLSHDSATETLRRWCAEHHLAAASDILAERVIGEDKPADSEVRAALDAAPSDTVRYRRVRLACGERILSEADNWYLPAKLTPDMNRLLDQTDTPFGVVVKPLNFQRRTLSANLLFSPLPDGWDLGGPVPATGGALAIPHQVIRHRAVLSTETGGPFSLVVETYTDKVLPDRAP